MQNSRVIRLVEKICANAKIKSRLGLGFACTTSLALTFSPAFAVDVFSTIEDERARILFNWQQDVNITPSLIGNQLSIQFNQDEQVDVKKLLSSLRPFVTNANQPNNRQIILTLDEAYGVQAFKDGKTNGVDLLIKDAKAKESLPLDPNEVTTDKAILTTDPSKVRPSEGKKPAQNPMLTTEEPQSNAQQPELSPMLPLGKPEYTPELAQKPTDDLGTKNKLYQLAEKLNKGKMVVGVKQNPISASFYFPFHQRTAAATTSYGGDLFVIFSSNKTIDIANLNTILPSFINKAEQIYHPNATILRFKGQPNTTIYSSGKQTGNGYEWQISATRRPFLPTNLIVPEFSAKPPITPHVFVNALQMAKAVDFENPTTGENITAIPSYSNESAVFPQRILPDLTMLRTGQGVAFIANEPDIRILRLRQGLRITKQGGLHMTSNAPELPLDELKSAEASSHTFYPYEDWRAPDKAGQNFATRELELINAISEADARKLPALRLSLTQLYMAEGFNMEALGLLELLQLNSPDFYNDYQLAALSGAANFMVGRMGEAERYFNDATIADEDETKLWKRAMEIAAGSKRNFNYFENNKRYISSYPPQMRIKLAMLAADSALAGKKYSLAQNILQQLSVDKLDENLPKYATYVAGRAAAELGDMINAQAMLNPLVEDIENNFLRARAAFSLATNRYRKGEIDRPELIAQLEKIGLLWRGDNFEMNLLNLLGELYVNNEQPLEGLRSWRDVITYFPNSEIALEVAGKMATTFAKLFNDGKADEMTPLEALALYYEFRDLTPIGAAGDQMVQQLADRLAGVDLLDKAAKLLEYQVTYRLDKQDRSRVATKLAMIYLLNREPEKTIKVLELTGYGDNDESLTTERNHLAAIAYGKIGKWQRAMNLLRDDYSREAKYIRADIYWDIKDWYNLAVGIEEILSGRTVPTDPLNSEETQSLLRLCVAYGFMGESKQLAYLRDYFTPLVEDEGNKKIFAFLTSATDVINRDNLAQVSEEIAKMKGFLDNYKVNVGSDKLRNIITSMK